MSILHSASRALTRYVVGAYTNPLDANTAKLGLNTGDGDKLNDAVFDAGTLSDAQSLGDKGTTGQDGTFQPAWDPSFAAQDIDGLILVTGDCRSTVTDAVKDVKDLFGGKQQSSITEAFSIVGDVRPGAEDGHEQ